MSRTDYGSRTCPECSGAFRARHVGAVFCSPAHQAAFHNRSAKRGKVAAPLIQIWRMGKRGRTDDTAFAQAELSALADIWNAEDKAAGRRPDIVVSNKRRDGWRATDLG